jgi:hypothetical protein
MSQIRRGFSGLLTYLVIDFRARKSLDIINIAGQYDTYTITPDEGLGRYDNLTWGFKVPDIIAYLSIPRQLRNPEYGLYRAANTGDELVVRASSEVNWWGANTSSFTAFYREVDYANIICATFGVEVGWRPYQYSSFILNLVESVVGMGLGFIPGVGPLLSVAFGIGVQLLEDPDSFSSDNVLEIGVGIIESLVGSASKSKKYMAPAALPKRSSVGVSAPTDEERAARKAAGEELNARLTETIRNRVAGKSPTDTEGWQMRFADLRRVATEIKESKLQSVDVVDRTPSTVTGGNTISVQINSTGQEVAEAHLRFK